MGVTASEPLKDRKDTDASLEKDECKEVDVLEEKTDVIASESEQAEDTLMDRVS